ncbi:uracil-DNA glycosylase [Ignatzschineria sp. F8392]|uniref:uracil-DNA glycosylase n=1 Tax=Ignatzschineria sp. F8392 TaxID=1980117 RepID=UPI002100E75A|nr:uracil-DNA glycosylase [Ignatzschineria sp. F8392]
MKFDLTKIDPQWREFIKSEMEKSYFRQIEQGIAQSIEKGVRVFPPMESIFSAFQVAPDQIKVVILGQDPYHGLGQAHGLAFSVQPGVKIPPSLRNIYQELTTDIPGFEPPQTGDLTAWSEQGVFLLNTVLTVEESRAHSHAKIGWEQFTTAVIDYLADHYQHLVFILWGNHAQKKGETIDRNRHLILDAAHPSPLSAYRGFFGSKPFSKSNQYLLDKGKGAIEWQL